MGIPKDNDVAATTQVHVEAKADRGEVDRVRANLVVRAEGDDPSELAPYLCLAPWHVPPAASPLMPSQPDPIGLTLGHVRVNGGCATAIMRTWRPGEAGYCRLCPSAECRVDRWDACLVTVPDHVPAESAPLFSLIAWRAGRGAGVGEVDGLAD